MLQPDKIIRSNRKTLSVCVDVFGAVTVRAPRRCDEKRIFAFLQEKESWILRKKAEMQGAGMCLPPENLDGYTFLYRIVPSKVRTHKVESSKFRKFKDRCGSRLKYQTNRMEEILG